MGAAPAPVPSHSQAPQPSCHLGRGLSSQLHGHGGRCQLQGSGAGAQLLGMGFHGSHPENGPMSATSPAILLFLFISKGLKTQLNTLQIIYSCFCSRRGVPVDQQQYFRSNAIAWQPPAPHTTSPDGQTQDAGPAPAHCPAWGALHCQETSPPPLQHVGQNRDRGAGPAPWPCFGGWKARRRRRAGLRVGWPARAASPSPSGLGRGLAPSLMDGASVNDLVHCGLLVTRARNDELVIAGDVTAQHRGGLFRLNVREAGGEGSTGG